MVFIAQERGPKSNPCFPLGCNWKESKSGRGGGEYRAWVQDGAHPARGKAGYLWGLTAGSASFSEYLETLPPPFRCWKGRLLGPVPYHFGASGVIFRLSEMSLGQRMPQCSQPYCQHLPSAFTSIITVFLRVVASDEGGEDMQSAGVEVGIGAR